MRKCDSFSCEWFGTSTWSLLLSLATGSTSSRLWYGKSPVSMSSWLRRTGERVNVIGHLAAPNSTNPPNSTKASIQPEISGEDPEQNLFNWERGFYPNLSSPSTGLIFISNIQSGFAAAGLIPLFPETVLSKIPKAPITPPSTSHSNQSFGVCPTPTNLYQIEQQKKKNWRKIEEI